jgi:hypothetical protein
MTSNKYIVKNCPAILRMTKVCDAYETTRDLPQLCKNCTDCVIKQVIEKCKEHPLKDCACGDDILQLFDIEEVKCCLKVIVRQLSSLKQLTKSTS